MLSIENISNDGIKGKLLITASSDEGLLVMMCLFIKNEPYEWCLPVIDLNDKIDLISKITRGRISINDNEQIKLIKYNKQTLIHIHFPKEFYLSKSKLHSKIIGYSDFIWVKASSLSGFVKHRKMLNGYFFWENHCATLVKLFENNPDLNIFK